MIDCGSLDYAQARIQARHGQRAGELDWQRLETTRDFAALLEVARQSPLRPWVTGIVAPARPAQIEGRLRAQWRTAVDEVARWMPERWQASLHWCAALPELPALQHLARGHEAPSWMHDDAELCALAAAAPDERPAALADSRFAPLAAAWTAPEALAQAWHAEWLRRLPAAAQQPDPGLGRLAAALREHAVRFAVAAPAQGWLLRRALQARLVLLLRRSIGEPAVAFIHLALTALELERLRGELLGRALFPHRQVA